jgi:hypothetical protein
MNVERSTPMDALVRRFAAPARRGLRRGSRSAIARASGMTGRGRKQGRLAE